MDRLRPRQDDPLDPGRILEGPEHLGHRRSRARMADLGGDFAERLQDKSPQVHAGVRNHELRSVEDLLVVEEKVEIQHPGAPRNPSFGAPGLPLERPELAKERLGEEPGA
jgi:hypothetical protein